MDLNTLGLIDRLSAFYTLQPHLLNPDGAVNECLHACYKFRRANPNLPIEILYLVGYRTEPPRLHPIHKANKQASPFFHAVLQIYDDVFDLTFRQMDTEGPACHVATRASVQSDWLRCYEHSLNLTDLAFLLEKKAS